MNIALVLSGGVGTRLGADIPKQYIDVNDRMIIDYCLETLDKSCYIDAIQIVAEKEWQVKINKPKKFAGFSNPGENRQLSIYNGIKDISKTFGQFNNTVLIHDAARPNLSEETIELCIKAIQEGYEGAMPVLPMKDTVYRSDDSKSVTQLMDRSEIYAGQAPELFVLDKYLAANNDLMPEKIKNINGSTEPAIIAGMNIAMVKGDENNYKITTKADLERFIKEQE